MKYKYANGKTHFLDSHAPQRLSSSAILVPERWFLVWMFLAKYSRDALLRRIFTRSKSWYRDLPLDAERRD